MNICKYAHIAITKNRSAENIQKNIPILLSIVITLHIAIISYCNLSYCQTLVQLLDTYIAQDDQKNYSNCEEINKFAYLMQNATRFEQDHLKPISKATCTKPLSKIEIAKILSGWNPNICEHEIVQIIKDCLVNFSISEEETSYLHEIYIGQSIIDAIRDHKNEIFKLKTTDLEITTTRSYEDWILSGETQKQICLIPCFAQIVPSEKYYLFNPSKNIKFPIDTENMLPGSSHKVKFHPAHGSHPFSKHFLLGGIASVLSGILISQLTQDAEYYNDCHTVYSWPETGFEERTECEQKKKRSIS